MASCILLGDANLDGVVDVADFNLWNGADFQVSGGWSLAHFNAMAHRMSDFGIFGI